MQCKKCGATVDPFAGYCENCGTEIPKDVVRSAWKAKAKTFCLNAISFIKKRWLWFSIGAFVLVVGVTVFSIVGKPKIINLSDYLIYESSGYDGYGKLSVALDSDKLSEVILGKESKDDDKYNEYGDVMESIKDSITMSYDAEGNYKNGDVIKVEISAAEPDIFTQKNYEWENSEFTLRITIGEDTLPLDELKTINLWEYLDSEITGYEGFASVSYTIRYEDLCTDLFGEKPDPKESYYDYEKWTSQLQSIQSNITVENEASSALKTGDSYAVKFKVRDLNAYKEHGCVIVESDLGKLHTVGTDTSAPKPITKVDLTQAIQVTYNYNSFWKEYSISYPDEDLTLDVVSVDGTPFTLTISLSSYTYYCVVYKLHSSLYPEVSAVIRFDTDSTGTLSDIKNGDQITFAWNGSQDFVKKLGIFPTETTKIITVSGLE